MGDKSLGELCTNLYNESFREGFEQFQKHQKYPVTWLTCPYPSGPNEIYDFMIDDYAKYLPPYIPGSEKWRIEVRFEKDNVTIGGANAYGILRNNRSLLYNGG